MPPISKAELQGRPPGSDRDHGGRDVSLVAVINVSSKIASRNYSIAGIGSTHHVSSFRDILAANFTLGTLRMPIFRLTIRLMEINGWIKISYMMIFKIAILKLALGRSFVAKCCCRY